MTALVEFILWAAAVLTAYVLSAVIVGFWLVIVLAVIGLAVRDR